MAEPVKVTFLGGLGEIGRNCACIEVDGRILLLDCGLMFPDIDMLGIDLVLPDFTYLRDNADRIDGASSPTATRTTWAGLSFLLRELSFPIYGSALTLGLARNRIEEAGLLDRTELIPVRDGERRADRPVRRRVHPRHPLGAARVRHRVPHAAGHDPALGRLQARPHAGRRPPHRPRPASAPSPSGDGIRLLLSDSTNADEPGHARSETLGGQGALRPVPRARGPAHRHRLLRQPHPPRPADRRRRHGVRAQGGHARPVDEEERAAGPRDGAAAHPRPRAGRHRRRPRPAARAGVRDLDRQPGRADVGAVADGRSATTGGSRSTPTTRSSSPRTRSRATR